MKVWNVLLAGAGVPASDAEEIADALIDVLATHAPAIRIAPDALEVALSVEAPTPWEALAVGGDLTSTALRALGVEAWEASSNTVEDGSVEPGPANEIPPLVGVAEVAELLRVSRQRVSALQKQHNFPPPVAHLRSGPVWLESSITSFLGEWDRSSGRRPAKGHKVVA